MHIVSGRIIDDDDHQLLMMDNLEWTLSNIDTYLDHGLESVVIFGHSQANDVHNDYFNSLSEAVRGLNIEVAYVHGDTSNWKIIQGAFGADNMMDINIKSDKMKPLKITAIKGDSTPFRFERDITHE